MRIIKRLSPEISPHLMHLINSIINTSTFPNILKVQKIMPTLKADKVVNDIDSYCPINNLSIIEKIVEQYIKDCLNEFCELTI